MIHLGFQRIFFNYDELLKYIISYEKKKKNFFVKLYFSIIKLIIFTLNFELNLILFVG